MKKFISLALAFALVFSLSACKNKETKKEEEKPQFSINGEYITEIEKEIVLDREPTAENTRNSEGSFIRLKNGKILFAYSRFGTAAGDNSPSDIYCMSSDDEGETWTDLGAIVKASTFGVTNVMSVSSMELKDGSAAFFFLIKEGNDPTADSASSIGMAVTEDGKKFKVRRCDCQFEGGYYVINNDRFIRLSDGRIAAPACQHARMIDYEDGSRRLVGCATNIRILVSDDEGKTFKFATEDGIGLIEKYSSTGIYIEEPGLLETEKGKFILWARNNSGSQFVTRSEDGLENFDVMRPSEFISPQSPMSMLKDGKTIYAVYNPNPNPNFPNGPQYTLGRTQLVIRKSTDAAKTFSEPKFVEIAIDRGFCYTAMFATKDNSLLLAYCAGGESDKYCLNRLRIVKISKDVI